MTPYITHQEAFKYYRKLAEYYKSGVVEINPCEIETNDDIKLLIQYLHGEFLADGKLKWLTQSPASQTTREAVGMRINICQSSTLIICEQHSQHYQKTSNKNHKTKNSNVYIKARIRICRMEE